MERAGSMGGDGGVGGGREELKWGGGEGEGSDGGWGWVGGWVVGLEGLGRRCGLGDSDEFQTGYEDEGRNGRLKRRGLSCVVVCSTVQYSTVS